MKLRLILAVWACKLAIVASRLLGKKGTSMPGQIAFKICPDMLRLLSRQVKKEIIVVCGTNGKTTTNNLLASFIRSAGNRVVCNDVGANMIWGVCCSFAEKANLFGKLKADYACLEVDEASTVHVFKHIKPDLMVITNLFRDQLDRYGTVELTVDFLRRALSLSPDTKLLLNGDDPLTAQFGEKTERKAYFVSVEEDAGVAETAPVETPFCVFCGEALSYDFHHYSQLGAWHCDACGFKKRRADFSVRNVSLADGIGFTLLHDGKEDEFFVPYRGFYNVYNIALSYSAAVLSMGEVPDYQRVLDAYQPQVGRMESFMLSRPVILNMAKNPAGFNQAIATVLQDEREKDLLLAVNDNESDGCDITWLWDVEFERLGEAGIRRLLVSGLRADELALRLKYAGFPEEKIEKVTPLRDAVTSAIDGETPVCYALANYTAVFPMQSILKELEGKKNHGA